MKTKEEYTEEETERAEELARKLVDANIRHLNSNLTDEASAEEIRESRRDLEAMGFMIQCVNSYDFGTGKYRSVVTLFVPRTVH